jgi:TonB family protein
MKTRLAWLLAGCSILLMVVLAVSLVVRHSRQRSPRVRELSHFSHVDWSKGPPREPLLSRGDSIEFELARLEDDADRMVGLMAEFVAEARLLGITGGRKWTVSASSHLDSARTYAEHARSSTGDGWATHVARAMREVALADSAMSRYRQHLRTSRGRSGPRIVAFWEADVKPRPDTIPNAEYPDGMLGLPARARVVVGVLIGVTGSPELTVVWKTSGHPQLDSAALRAARQARFTPGLSGDEPVRVWVSVPYKFAPTPPP